MSWKNRLRMMRMLRGMKQPELEDLANVPKTYLSAIEQGHMLPTPDVQARLEIALGWPPLGLADVAFAILEGEVSTKEQALAAVNAAVTVEEVTP